MWAHFFGYGIQDPIDEPGDNNPPSHPELLERLGRAFADVKFDNRVLIRGIVRSQAYQLSSKPPPVRQDESQGAHSASVVRFDGRGDRTSRACIHEAKPV